MNIDKIVEVNIQISEAMSIDGGYDTILIVGPLPKAPGGRVTPDVAGYASLQDLKERRIRSGRPCVHWCQQGVWTVPKAARGNDRSAEAVQRLHRKGGCDS